MEKEESKEGRGKKRAWEKKQIPKEEEVIKRVDQYKKPEGVGKKD